MNDLESVLTKLSKAPGTPTGWVGADVSPELKARLRLMHRYIRGEDIGEKGLERHPHITVAYGARDDADSPRVREMLRAPRGARVMVGDMGVFDTPGADVLKFEVLSDDLHRAHQKIKDDIGLPGETHPEYSPHITVAYLKKGSNLNRYRPLEKLLKGKVFDVDKTNVKLGDREFDSGQLVES